MSSQGLRVRTYHPLQLPATITTTTIVFLSEAQHCNNLGHPGQLVSPRETEGSHCPA